MLTIYIILFLAALAEDWWLRRKIKPPKKNDENIYSCLFLLSASDLQARQANCSGAVFVVIVLLVFLYLWYRRNR